jgi:hypothetical protein
MARSQNCTPVAISNSMWSGWSSPGRGMVVGDVRILNGFGV